MFKGLFQALLGQQQKNAPKHFIARHLAKNALYERKGVEALLPDLKDKVILLQARMEALGMPVMVFEGFRTVKRQNDLYAQGRTKSGRIVTNARGFQSNHQYGIAVDIVFKRYYWNPPYSSWWDVLGEEGEKLGLSWGGRWKSKDRPHFELEVGITLKELMKYFI